MKSIHQHFDAFLQKDYPGVGPKAVQAMRRAFMAGYGAHAGHALELMGTEDLETALGKAVALKNSATSFLIDCDKDG